MRLAADLRVPTVTADEIRRATEEVLSRSEFSGARPSLMRRILQAGLELLGRVLETLAGGGRGSVIATVVLVVAVALLAAAVVVFTRRVARGASVRTDDTGPVGRSPQDWFAEAAGHERSGEWREALRCRYRALLAQLAAAGLTDEVPGRTSGEYLVAVTGSVPAAASSFTTVTRAFESAWYGSADVTRADVDAFASAAADVARRAGIKAREPVGAAP